jgi:hypothetical protein
MVGRATAGIALCTVVLGGAAWAKLENTRPQTSEGVVDPRADAILRGMTNYMGSLRSLRVDAITIDEKVSTAGQKIQEVKESKISVQRPNQIAIDRTGPRGHVLFRYDGKRYVLYGVNHNIYASAPAPSTLEAAIDDAQNRFGIDAPGGDLIAGDSYHELLDGVSEGRYIGLEPIEGQLAHHLAVRKDKVDYEIWIKDGPEPVPLRYVITSRDVQGQPQFTLELRNFTPNPPLSESSFAFVAPPGAQQVALEKRPRM